MITGSRLSLLALRAFVIFLLIAGAFLPTNRTVHADDGQPPAPPEETVPPADPPQTNPPEDASITDNQAMDTPTSSTPTETPIPADNPAGDAGVPSVQEFVQSLPEDTGLVLKDEAGTVVPLADAAAQEILAEGDPWYCPAGVTWNSEATGCAKFIAAGQNNLQKALDYALTQSTSGTIYIEAGQSFGHILTDFSGLAEGVSLNLVGGFDLSQGLVTGTSTLNSLTMSNFTTGGNLVISNLNINKNSDTTAPAVSLQTMKNLELNQIKVTDNDPGSAIAISGMSDNVVLNDVTIIESNNGQGLVVNTSNHVHLNRVHITESGAGSGIQAVATGDLVIVDSSVVENGSGYGLQFLVNNQPKVTRTSIQSNSDSDPVLYLESNTDMDLSNLTVTANQPVYSASAGAMNSAVFILNGTGKAAFNQNTLQINKPAGTATGFYNGMAFMVTDPSEPVLVFSGTGNSLDGGLTGTGSDAVFIDSSSSGSSVIFNWNRICNWTQGYFNNKSTKLTVDGRNNYYCGEVPSSVDSPIKIRGLVNYLPYATLDDVDGDSVVNWQDTCPNVSNPGTGQTADMDKDSLPDACDPDGDGDGFDNSVDTCPLVSSSTNVDTDGDGLGDACDPTPLGDSDNDGVQNPDDICPGYDDNVDTDLDGVPNGCDLTPTGDDDGDGIDNASDNCPSLNTTDLTDSDGDGEGDACDLTPHGDSDSDAIDNLADNCPTTSNHDQLDTDHDGKGDLCDSTPNGDMDMDGIDDLADNCQSVANPHQEDTDKDHIGNACDSTPNGDRDGDLVDNLTDNCPDQFNPLQTDSNGNGIGDACESRPDTHGNTPSGSGNGSNGDIPSTGSTVGTGCTNSAILTLAGGAQIHLEQLACDVLANAKIQTQANLPGALADSMGFQTAIHFQANSSGSDLASLPGKQTARISFRVPDLQKHWQVLFWNPDTGIWEEVASALENDVITVESNHTGWYVLVWIK
jgi:hypothetical protein